MSGNDCPKAKRFPHHGSITTACTPFFHHFFARELSKPNHKFCNVQNQPCMRASGHASNSIVGVRVVVVAVVVAYVVAAVVVALVLFLCVLGLLHIFSQKKTA